jgi:Spy/CpxP family protein refolding chaperone
MKTGFIVAIALAVTTVAASAAPARLTDSQMDRVTAGQIQNPPPTGGHWWHHLPLPSPPFHPIVGCFGRICA